MKVHLIDNRLKMNAGMRFPACKANEKLLDLNAVRLPMTDIVEEVTCSNCLKIYYKRGRY